MKEAIIFAIGLAVGATAAYFALKKKLTDEKDKEIDEIRDYYVKKYEAESEPKEKGESPEEEEDNEAILRVKRDPSKDYDYYTDMYSTDAPESSQEADRDVLDYEDDIDDDYHREDRNMAPQIVTPEEYEDLYLELERVELAYYVDDDRLVYYDNVDEEFDDRDIAFGPDALKEMGRYEEDMLHIVNERVGRKYEICQKYGHLLNDEY